MMTAHRIVAFIAVVCLVFSASAATAFASSSYPTAPGNVSSPDLLHLSGAFSAYYIKYSKSTTFTPASYLDSSGNVISFTGAAVSDYIALMPTLDKMICLFNHISSSFIYIRNVCFYDSNHNFISQSTGLFVSFTNIPSNAYYFRIGFFSGYNESQLAYYFRVLVSPSVETFSGLVPNSVFWRDYIYTYAFVQSDGDVSITLHSSYAVDEVFLEFRFSDSFISANLISGEFFFELRDGSYSNNYYPVYYTDPTEHVDKVSAFLMPFYEQSDGSVVISLSSYSESYSNPFRFNSTCPYNCFTGFRITVPLNQPTGILPNSDVHILLSDFHVDTNPVFVDAINVVNDLNISGEGLVLPTPNTGVIFDQIDGISNQMNNSAFRSVSWFGSNDGILASMMVTLLLFAALGYILFGKIA